MSLTEKDRKELREYSDPFSKGENMSNQEEINVISARLREMNKEFQDLSALKKKLVGQNAVSTFKKKYGDYKFIVKNKTNKDLDFDKLIAENDLKIHTSVYGLTCAAYNVGGQKVGYHIAKTEEEADQIRVVQGLFKVGDHITEQVKENKKLTAQEILDLYDGARNGQQLEEPAETEEVPE